MAAYAGEQHDTADEDNDQGEDGGDLPAPARGIAWHGLHLTRFLFGRSRNSQRMLSQSGGDGPVDLDAEIACIFGSRPSLSFKKFRSVSYSPPGALACGLIESR